MPPSLWGAARSWQRLAHPTAASLVWWAKRSLRAARGATLPPITFVENNARQTLELEGNVSKIRSRLEALEIGAPEIAVLHTDAFEAPDAVIAPRGVTTLLPLHPPYGLRLAKETDIETLYTRLGEAVGGWALEATHGGGALTGFCLCPSEALWSGFLKGLEGLNVDTSHVSQGGLDIRLCAFSTD